MKLLLSILLLLIFSYVIIGQPDSSQNKVMVDQAVHFQDDKIENSAHRKVLESLLKDSQYDKAIDYQFERVKSVLNSSSLINSYNELNLLDSLLSEHSLLISEDVKFTILKESFQFWADLNEQTGHRRNTLERFIDLKIKYNINSDSLSSRAIGSVIRSLRILGIDYFNINEYEEAIDYLKQSYDLSLEMGKEESRISNASLNLGYISYIYIDSNEIPDSIDLFYEHLRLAQRLFEMRETNVSHLITAYMRLAGLHLMNNNIDSSEYYFHESSKLEAKYSHYTFRSRMFKIHLLIKQKKLNEARNILSELYNSLNHKTKANFLFHYSRYLQVVNLMIDLEMNLDAEELFAFVESYRNGIIKNEKEDEIKSRVNDFLLEFLMTKLRMQNFSDESISLNKIEEAYQIIQDETKRISSKRSKMRFASNSDKLSKYFLEYFVNENVENKDIYNAFGSSKAAASVHEWLKNHYVDFNNSDDIFFLESEHEFVLENLTKKLEKSRDSLLKSSIQEEIDIYTSAFDSIKNDLSVEHPIYYKMKYNWSLPSMAEVKSSLQDDEVLVDYFEGQKCLYALILTQDSDHLVKIDSIETIKRLSNQFKDEIFDKRQYAYHDSEVSNRLYRKLIKPIKNHLRDRIIICPHGSLFQVPFEALEISSNDKNVKYFVHENAISYTPSAFIFHQLRIMEKDNVVKEALFVAPTFTESKPSNSLYAMRTGYKDLKYNIPEVLDVSKSLQSKILLNEHATKDSVLKLIDQADLIHFATHAKSNMDSPEKSHIAFYNENENLPENDHLLFINDISKHKLKSKMIVLSACETGLGQFYKGEGVMSLANSFFYGGGHSVVASLWSVYDQSTSEIMSGFYTYLDQDFTKDRALQLAQIDYLENNPGTDANPYYWAGFSVMGSTDALKFQKASIFRNLIFVTFGLIALFLFYAQFRLSTKSEVKS